MGANLLQISNIILFTVNIVNSDGHFLKGDRQIFQKFTVESVHIRVIESFFYNFLLKVRKLTIILYCKLV